MILHEEAYVNLFLYKNTQIRHDYKGESCLLRWLCKFQFNEAALMQNEISMEFSFCT